MSDINDDNAAFDIANKLIKNGNAKAFAYFVAGSILSTRKKPDDAIPLLKKSLSLEESSRTYAQLGFCYSEIGRDDLAMLYETKAVDPNLKKLC